MIQWIPAIGPFGPPFLERARCHSARAGQGPGRPASGRRIQVHELPGRRRRRGPSERTAGMPRRGGGCRGRLPRGLGRARGGRACGPRLCALAPVQVQWSARWACARELEMTRVHAAWPAAAQFLVFAFSCVYSEIAPTSVTYIGPVRSNPWTATGADSPSSRQPIAMLRPKSQHIQHGLAHSVVRDERRKGKGNSPCHAIRHRMRRW